MKFVLVAVIMFMLFVGCASYDVRNWNPETKTGQIVLFTGEDMFSSPTIEDAHDDLVESGRCPSGYIIKEIGWQGGGWVTRAEDPVPVTTTSSINVGGKEVASVVKSKGGKSGDSTVVKIGGLQTQGNAERNFHTIVRSPEEEQSSGEMRGKWYDFKCK